MSSSEGEEVHGKTKDNKWRDLNNGLEMKARGFWSAKLKQQKSIMRHRLGTQGAGRPRSGSSVQIAQPDELFPSSIIRYKTAMTARGHHVNARSVSIARSYSSYGRIRTGIFSLQSSKFLLCWGGKIWGKFKADNFRRKKDITPKFSIPFPLFI